MLIDIPGVIVSFRPEHPIVRILPPGMVIAGLPCQKRATLLLSGPWMSGVVEAPQGRARTGLDGLAGGMPEQLAKQLVQDRRVHAVDNWTLARHREGATSQGCSVRGEI